MSSQPPENKNEKSSWSESIKLPKTVFPMKAGLAQKEPHLVNYWSKNSILSRINKKRAEKKAPRFVLHDGPPYANGNFHVGHSLNKILKDIINKFYLLNGYQVPYVPGWDCHGLPIELAVLKKLSNRKKGEENNPAFVRKACRDYASDFIKIQAQDQSRFGVLWDDSYLEKTSEKEQETLPNFYYTMSSDYEAGILEAFRDLFQKKYIYKGKKPVYWDTVARTAMAEAEVEYEQHTSPSIYVKFPISDNSSFANSIKPEFIAIWTTTPWTLPANLALCFHSEFEYNVYKTNAGNIIIAAGLEEAFFSKTGLTFSSKEKVEKASIENCTAQHPFLERKSLIVYGSHVTLEAGTGIVHTAPGHGLDDYKVGLEYQLEPYSPVDHRGRYTSEFAMMEGVYVFDANEKIIELLKEKNLLINRTDIEHSYPHSWRSHSPLIFRATPQWFFRVDELKDRALEEAAKVKWIPAWGQKRFESMIENRPDWCLSRQRQWGVPIPAFTCSKCGETHMTVESLNHVINLIKEKGLEIWFDYKSEELLPSQSKCLKCGSDKLEKENDILDVWFDSGVSWYNVLKKNPSLNFPADIYLEGSDQHRGWFQSSLWPAIALENQAPYKQVITHAYVLDEKGKAMSKSLGNVISPVDDIIPKYGADILRLWVCSEDYKNDNRISFDMLDRLSDSYRKIRNTFRYILGNLDDGEESKNLPEDVINEDIDLWVLNELALLAEKVENGYKNFEFHQVYQRILSFCTVTLSNTYFDIIRDRLYCDVSSANTRESEFAGNRKSSIKTLQIIMDHLLIWLSPVLSFTTEEIYHVLHSGENSVFESSWPTTVSKWLNPAISEKLLPVWELKDRVNGYLEEARTKQIIKSSLEATVYLPESELSECSVSPEELDFYLVVSEIKASHESDIHIAKSEKQKCPRCWIYRDLTEKGLCPRCSRVV